MSGASSRGNPDVQRAQRSLAFDLPGVAPSPSRALLLLRELGACFLWEPARPGAKSYLGLSPRAELVVRGGRLFCSSPGEPPSLISENADPFSAATRLLSPVEPGPRPPMLGGAVGFLSYDAVRNLEYLPSLAPDVMATPEAAFLSLGAVLSFEEGGLKLYVLAAPDEEAEAKTLAAKVYEALNVQEERAGEPSPRLASSPPLPHGVWEGCREESRAGLSSEPLPHSVGEGSPSAAQTGERAHTMPPLPARDGRRATPEETTPSEEDFLRSVARAKEAILAGEIFQVVLSRRFSGHLGCPPGLLYQALRQVSPAPYQCYLEAGGVTLLSSSPEALLLSDGQRVTTWPIAGTRPRGKTPAEDKALAEELLADPKERSEHVMLVDLARNDLGRVSRPGSVTVRRFLEIEPKSHVLHLVSEVDGLLQENASTLDALRAVFPAGTVSGAPKVRAMELIEGLEGTRRGLYGGAFGYLGPEGEADFAITIRTLLLAGGRWHAQAGAGIVHESDPAREAAEIDAKAAAMLEAVYLAERAWEEELKK